MRALILFCLLTLLSGCVSMGGTPFVKDEFITPDKAVIYVYRPMALQGIGECYRVGVDGQYLGCLNAGGHYRFEVDPAEHQVWQTAAITPAADAAECKDNGFCKVITKEMEGGKAYYVQVESFVFKLVEERIGLQRASQTKGQPIAL